LLGNNTGGGEVRSLWISVVLPFMFTYLATGTTNSDLSKIRLEPDILERIKCLKSGIVSNSFALLTSVLCSSAPAVTRMNNNQGWILSV
jgi:hypothetical protein